MTPLKWEKYFSSLCNSKCNLSYIYITPTMKSTPSFVYWCFDLIKYDFDNLTGHLGMAQSLKHYLVLW